MSFHYLFLFMYYLSLFWIRFKNNAGGYAAVMSNATEPVRSVLSATVSWIVGDAALPPEPFISQNGCSEALKVERRHCETP